MRSSTLAAGLLAMAVSVAALAGCAAEPSSSSTDETPSPATTLPSPSAPAASAPPSGDVFAYPDTSDPDQVAIYLKFEGSDPSGQIIAGPAVLVANKRFLVEGQCEGSGASFEVVTADPAIEKRTLVEGDFTCNDLTAREFSYRLPYGGPVQVNLLDADDVGRAWVRVVQP